MSTDIQLTRDNPRKQDKLISNKICGDRAEVSGVQVALEYTFIPDGSVTISAGCESLMAGTKYTCHGAGQQVRLVDDGGQFRRPQRFRRRTGGFTVNRNGQAGGDPLRTGDRMQQKAVVRHVLDGDFHADRFVGDQRMTRHERHLLGRRAGGHIHSLRAAGECDVRRGDRQRRSESVREVRCRLVCLTGADQAVSDSQVVGVDGDVGVMFPGVAFRLRHQSVVNTRVGDRHARAVLGTVEVGH